MDKIVHKHIAPLVSVINELKTEICSLRNENARLPKYLTAPKKKDNGVNSSAYKESEGVVNTVKKPSDDHCSWKWERKADRK